MSGQAPPQYSPDGTWWWDGESWTPAGDGPPGKRPAAPPPAPTVETPAPRVLRVSVAALVAVLLATALLAGGALWAGRQAGLSSPGLHPAPTPHPLPSLAPPMRDYQYIPGLRVSDLIALARRHGMTCRAPTVFGKDMAEWRCLAMGRRTTFSLEFAGRSETKVWGVSTALDGGDHRPDRALVAPVLEEVAVLPVRSRPALAAQVHAWMEANFGLTTDAYFDSVQYAYSVGTTTYGLGISGG